MRTALAVDLGGTKLASAVVSEDGSVAGYRKETVQKGSVAAVAAQIAASVQQVLRETRTSPAGMGLIVPGIAYPDTGRVWAPNLWGHQTVELGAELQKRLSLAISLDCDRSGYVLSEQWLGAARGLKDVIFLAVGTGIGAGILSGGQLVRGAGGIAGAVGWYALSPHWRDDYAQTGCWEAEAAGPALARMAGTDSAEQAVEAARRGDGRAVEAIRHTVEYLAMGIANLVSALNPEMIVLGGGLMQASDLFLDPLRREFVRWAQPVAARQVKIEVTQLGERAGLLGAARLVLRD